MHGLLSFVSILVLAWASSAARADVIVDAAQVEAAAQRGALLWDVRAASDYQRGHIPGAVNIGDPQALLREPNSEDFIATERIAALLGAAGIDPRREVVIYGARGATAPYFARYTLRFFGATQAAVFHDGIDGWVAAGKPLASQAPKPQPVELALRSAAGVAVSTAEVVERLGRTGVQIIDARTPAEFAGEDVRAIRGGHVPGAINIPYEQNWRDPEAAAKLARRQSSDTSGLALKPEDELRKLYGGLELERETIVYCQSGVRAAQTAGVLQQLGFTRVRVYDASWLGYAARLDAPVQNEVFFNVGAMNARVGALQRRVDELEALLRRLAPAAGAN